MGPTASGKSALGIELALRFDGEIINCDSVQVYRDIEIATAKIPLHERRGVPHHLLDFAPPAEPYTAGRWARDARVAITDIEARGRLPVIVGGTGLYLRALREPFFQSPPTDARLRARLTSIRERRGTTHLHRMLRRVDAQTAARLPPADWTRIMRALEIRFQTKRTLGEQLAAANERPSDEQLAADSQAHDRQEFAARLGERLHIFALNPPREALYERINERTLAHFRLGLVDEVRDLLARGVPAASSALGAHGYRRVVEYLHGQRTLESAIERTQIDVRQYAKRQWTWFRREPGVEWVSGFGDDAAVAERVARRVCVLFESG